MGKLLVASVGFLALAVPALALATPAMAQGVPPQLANSRRDVPFLMHVEPGVGCSIGVKRLTKFGGGKNVCLVSIDQCLTQMHGSILQNPWGWGCKAP